MDSEVSVNPDENPLDRRNIRPRLRGTSSFTVPGGRDGLGLRGGFSVITNAMSAMQENYSEMASIFREFSERERRQDFVTNFMAIYDNIDRVTTQLRNTTEEDVRATLQFRLDILNRELERMRSM